MEDSTAVRRHAQGVPGEFVFIAAVDAGTVRAGRQEDAGMVNGVRIQQTRRGRMGVVTLDDGSAQVEMTVFNEIFEASRPWICEDELLVVRGKASLDDYSGNMRISADELFDFASARSTFARRLELTVSAASTVSTLSAVACVRKLVAIRSLRTISKAPMAI